MQESEIETLLAQARAEGRFDSSGSFTVLLRRAQNHAGKDFARLYPGGYLLKAVQCAVAAGCQDIRIQCVPTLATVQMLGPGPARVGSRILEALQNPLSFKSQDPMGHLAMCILAALAQGASRVEWSCFDGQQGEVLTVNQDTVDLKTLPQKSGPTGFTLTVHREAAKLPSELHMLQSRCGFCPVSLTLNRKQLRGAAWLENRPPTMSDWYKGYAQPGFRLAECYLYRGKSVARNQSLGLPAFGKARYFAVDKEPFQFGWAPRDQKVFLGLNIHSPLLPTGAIAFPIEMAGKSRVTWVQYGVCLESEFHDLGFPGAIAVLEASQLSTDLTGLKVVQDADQLEALELIRDETSVLLKRYQKLAPALTACPEGSPIMRRIQIGAGVTLGVVSLTTGLLPLAGWGALQVAAGLLSSKDAVKQFTRRAGIFRSMIDSRIRLPL